MRVRLPEYWINFLIRQPESGMGYHRVDVTFEDGSESLDCVVVNSEEIELPSEQRGKTIAEIRVRRPPNG